LPAVCSATEKRVDCLQRQQVASDTNFVLKRVTPGSGLPDRSFHSSGSVAFARTLHPGRCIIYKLVCMPLYYKHIRLSIRGQPTQCTRCEMDLFACIFNNAHNTHPQIKQPRAPKQKSRSSLSGTCERVGPLMRAWVNFIISERRARMKTAAFVFGTMGPVFVIKVDICVADLCV